MQVLFDTSVWIRHFRAGEQQLAAALEEGRLLIHEAIIGELCVGRLPKPKSILNDLLRLPFAPLVPFAELLMLVQERRLISKGLSWIDIHLIASALAAGADLVTYERPLAAAWKVIRRAE